MKVRQACIDAVRRARVTLKASCARGVFEQETRGLEVFVSPGTGEANQTRQLRQSKRCRSQPVGIVVADDRLDMRRLAGDFDDHGVAKSVRVVRARTPPRRASARYAPTADPSTRSPASPTNTATSNEAVQESSVRLNVTRNGSITRFTHVALVGLGSEHRG